ncbi:MAG: radical SAM family heme chaperone HemW [Granulosicoccus sp.]
MNLCRSFTELPPLSLYVHIPWCIRKCPYCDFNSHEKKSDLPEEQYVDALLEDLASEMPSVWGRTISTVFIGGGTPSLFSAQALDKLMSGIRALTGLSPSAEVTLEANPGTFEQQRFKDYRSLGINRLSIGVQSFNAQALSALGRVHSSQEAIRAVDIAHKAGFEQINLDIMFGLPDQSLAAALSDIQQAVELSTTHLSCYELTLEPNTLFARFPPAVPDEDVRATMQQSIIDVLSGAGFERYEISAYARQTAPYSTSSNGDPVPGSKHRSQHNLNYWQFGDYIGIGAGAHGKISSAAEGTITRRWKQKHPNRYLNSSSSDERLGDQKIIPIEETALEFMMNALRLTQGFALPLFELNTGVSLMHWQHTIEQARDRGLLQQNGLNLQATPMGINWLNDVLELFLPDDQPKTGHNLSSKTELPGESSARRYPIIPLNLKKD